MTADEWICEIKSHLATCKLPVDEQAAFIIEHLTGKARREIIGRGSMVARDPEKIFSVLISVFGDGASLPTLQERFFSYHQGDTEDIVNLSLELVDLYDRIARLDPTFLPSRESTLKGRLASAVRDENLRRELRRLNDESPELSFFELRDRWVQWIGTPSVKVATRKQKDAIVNEVSAQQNLLDVIKKQFD